MTSDSMRQKTRFKGLIKLQHLKIMQVALVFALAALGFVFVMLPVGRMADNILHVVMLKLMTILFIGIPVFFFFSLISRILPKDTVGSYVQFYRKSLYTEANYPETDSDFKDKMSKHLQYLDDVSQFLDTTPDDIRQMEKTVRAAERKISAANKVSSAATGYGLGKKTEL